MSTSVRPSAESPLADESYATAGIVKLPAIRCQPRTRPPSRAIRSTSVESPSGMVTKRSVLPTDVTPCEPTSIPSTGSPSADAAPLSARAPVTAATRTSARIGDQYVSDARRGPRCSSAGRDRPEQAVLLAARAREEVQGRDRAGRRAVTEGDGPEPVDRDRRAVTDPQLPLVDP